MKENKGKKRSEADDVRNYEEVFPGEHQERSEELECWDRSCNEVEANPYLHPEIHEIIEKQLSTNTPPEVRQTLERLMKSGLSRHDSIHKIGTALVGEIYDVLRDKEQYDEKRYIERLKKLR